MKPRNEVLRIPGFKAGMSINAQIAIFAEEWRRLMTSCGVPQSDKSTRAFDRLISAYSEPHRHYHNLTHVFWMLNVIFDMAFVYPFLCMLNIRLAAWYHDVVYDPQSVDNEARSADVAASSLIDLGVPKDTIGRVVGLILMTKDHRRIPKDEEADLFLDVDLGILGTSPQTYADYATAIRKEYAWASDHDFYTGRRKALQEFLKRDKIFRRDCADVYTEKQARANIIHEVAQIDNILKNSTP